VSGARDFQEWTHYVTEWRGMKSGGEPKTVALGSVRSTLLGEIGLRYLGLTIPVVVK
jgi:hypothetical protein